MPHPHQYHACPIASCLVTTLPFGILLCNAHWHRVPRELRAALIRAWNGGHPDQSYPSLRQAAIDAVDSGSKG
jgi:hypothetical protein